MRIFIDVGGHYGETLGFALDPRWGFDRVYSIEPRAACVAVLRSYSDRRLRGEPIALSDHNGTAELQGAGLRGGSLYAGKRVIERNERSFAPRPSPWCGQASGSPRKSRRVRRCSSR